MTQTTINLQTTLKRQFKSYHLLVFLAILVIGFAVYFNSLESSFHFDDQAYIQGNPNIRTLTNLDVTFWANPTVFLTYLSFALNYQYAHFEVFGYHVFNTFIHIFSSYLVYWLLFLTLKIETNDKIKRYPHLIPFFSALLFLCHPLQTQAVTYIAQRATSLATLFYLLGLVLYIKARLSENVWILTLAAIITAMAMFTKEIAFTLPITICVYDFIFLNYKKEPLPTRLATFFPFLLSLLIIPSIRFFYLALKGTPTFSNIALETTAIPKLHYLFTEFNVIRTYLRLLFLPINQNIDYDYPISTNLFELHTLLSLTLLISLLLIAIKALKHHKSIAFGIFWFFITLSVESSFIPIKDVIFEHRLYLPMVGFSLFASVGLFSILNNIKPYIISLSFIICALSFLTTERNKIWKNEISLWGDSVQKNPTNPRALQNSANAYLQEVRPLDALPYLENAIKYAKNRKMMDDATTVSLYNLGRVYVIIKKYTLAIQSLSEAVSRHPDFAQAWAFLGFAYQNTGDYKKAEDAYKRSEQINPNNPTLYEFLSSYFKKIHNDQKAEVYLRKALKLRGLDEATIESLLNNQSFKGKNK